MSGSSVAWKSTTPLACAGSWPGGARAASRPSGREDPHTSPATSRPVVQSGSSYATQPTGGG
jgi:hypothetical protein